MNDIGLQDLPPDVIDALRRCPRLLKAASFSRGREGRSYIRLDLASVDRDELVELTSCPLLARLMVPSVTLVFDPDQAAADERDRKRAAMLADLGEVAPEVAAGTISREMSG